MPLVSSYSSLQGILSGPSAWLANMLIHPAVFVTSPFFTEKTVTIDGTQVWSGRRVWLLDGIANPLAAPDPTLGNRWRAWVDTNTGIVLRLEYYSGNDLLGSAELREITIDGTGSQRRYTFAAIPPVGARSVSVFEYEQSFKPLN